MRRRLLPILATLAGAALLGLLIYGVTAQSASRTLDQQIADGRFPSAPDAHEALPVLGGHGKNSLAALRGKIVVLNFWASWCEPCQVEAPLLEHYSKSLARRGGAVLGVTYLDAAPDSQGFIRHNRLSYLNLRDNSGTFAHAYGTDKLPETFVIDRTGHVVAISRGEINEAFLNHAVARAEHS